MNKQLIRHMAGAFASAALTTAAAILARHIVRSVANKKRWIMSDQKLDITLDHSMDCSDATATY